MAQSKVSDLDSDPDDAIEPSLPRFESNLEPMEPEPTPEIEVVIGEEVEEVEEVEEAEEEKKPAKDEDDLDYWVSKPKKAQEIKNRIIREHRIVLRERARADEERAGRLEAEQRIAELEAKVFADSFDDDIKKAKEKYNSARADGDMDAEVDAVAAIADLSSKKNTPQPRRVEQVVQRTQVPEAQESWLDRNAHWYGKDAFVPQHNAAADISATLLDEGMDLRKESFWNELDRRLHDSVKVPQKEKPRSPVAGVKPGNAQSKTRVVISEDERAIARKLHIDLTDPKQLEHYARQIGRSA